jgi:hypothetical protein
VTPAGRRHLAPLIAAALVVAAVAPASAQTADAARGLRGVVRVAVEVAVAADLIDIEDDLQLLVERLLRENPPAPAPDQASPQVIRLVVAVHAKSATELRGFWLPFSGTYAVGHVRLEVERPLALPGPTPAATIPLRAVVWQRDRLVAVPWPHVAAETAVAVQALVGAFLEDYRRAR